MMTGILGMLLSDLQMHGWHFMYVGLGMQEVEILVR